MDAGGKGLLLDLGNETLMVGAVCIPVKQPVELRRCGEGECDQPEQKYRPGGNSHAAPLMLQCGQPFHPPTKEHHLCHFASDYFRPAAFGYGLDLDY
jgi:hypothetical protein